MNKQLLIIPFLAMALFGNAQALDKIRLCKQAIGAGFGMTVEKADSLLLTEQRKDQNYAFVPADSTDPATYSCYLVIGQEYASVTKEEAGKLYQKDITGYVWKGKLYLHVVPEPRGDWKDYL